MKRGLFRVVFTVVVSLFVLACSGDGDSGDPALCQPMAQAGLACAYSGLSEAKAAEVQAICEKNPKGVECALEAYQNHCKSITELLEAMKNCQ